MGIGVSVAAGEADAPACCANAVPAAFRDRKSFWMAPAAPAALALGERPLGAPRAATSAPTPEACGLADEPGVALPRTTAPGRVGAELLRAGKSRPVAGVTCCTAAGGAGENRAGLVAAACAATPGTGVAAMVGVAPETDDVTAPRDATVGAARLAGAPGPRPNEASRNARPIARLNRPASSRMATRFHDGGGGTSPARQARGLRGARGLVDRDGTLRYRSAPMRDGC